MQAIDVYLEIGKAKTFAGAIEWPGWCRSGQDEASAQQALYDYALRYAAVIHSAQLEFQPPADTSAFTIIERLKGDASTDFGAPGKIPAYDGSPLGGAELHRLQALLGACWQALDSAFRSAEGRELRTGPRGGGRSLEKILLHVLEAEKAYLRRLGYKPTMPASGAFSETIAQFQGEIMLALASAANGELPAQGPRGGVRWPLRYYVRRSAWHILDHAWEIEDRMI